MDTYVYASKTAVLVEPSELLEKKLVSRAEFNAY